MKHLLGIKDMSTEEIVETLELAEHIKNNPEQYNDLLFGKSLVMLFQKTSTRTRISFEVAMTQLGGHAIYVDWRTTNFINGKLADEIKCVGCYADGIMARVYAHEDLEIMAIAAGVPVINGLSDLEHPCQILADLLTIYERKGIVDVSKAFDGIRVAYVGDGNNVCNSLIAGCTKLDVDIAVATPPGYEPNKDIVIAAQGTGKLYLTHSPQEAVAGADIVYTDTWVSLGQEAETTERNSIFVPYQVNTALLAKAAEDALVMHCLPAHRGYEITSDILDSPESIVFEQAENRLHVQKAALVKLLCVQ